MKSSQLTTIFILLATILVTILVSVFMLFPQSIRLDEAQSIWQATKSIPAFISLTGQNVHVPLYGMLLHFWLQIFGTSVVAARSLSLLLFVFTVPALYILARESGGRKVAYFTIILFSLSPFIVWYSNEARMYTLFLFAATLNNLFFLRMYRSDGKEGKLGFFLSTVLGFYSHYFFVFLVATQSLFVISKLSGVLHSTNDFNAAPSLSPFRRYLPFALKFFALLISSFLFLLPWLVYVFLLGNAANTQPLIPPPTSFSVFQSLIEFIFGFQNSNLQGIMISLWPFLVLMTIILFTQRRKIPAANFEYFIVVTFLPILLVFVASFIKPIFLTRYLILVTPTLFFILAAVLVNYTQRITYIITTISIVVLFLLLINQNVSASTPVKENYAGVANYLNQTVKPTDIIAISSPFTVYPIEYYYTGTASLETIPEWNRYSQGAIPNFSEKTFATQIANDKKIYTYLYLVLSYDQGYEHTIITFMDKHFERKAIKTFSPGLQVRVYQLRYSSM
jgi:uncharacterized membrane protein